MYILYFINDKKEMVFNKIGEFLELRKIVEDTKPPPMNSIKARPTPNNNMDFNTFAKYMMKYETMKDAYNKHKNKTKAIPIPKKKPEPKKEEYHPKHYPLSMYAPTNRYKEFTGF